MKDPYICVASGNSYEKEAISEHVASCYKNFEQPYDPLTRAVITDPLKEIVPNRTLQSAIQDWEQRSPGSNVGAAADVRAALEEERRIHQEDAERIRVLEARLRSYEQAQQKQPASVMSFMEKSPEDGRLQLTDTDKTAKEGGIKPLISMLSDSSAAAVRKEKAAGELMNLAEGWENNNQVSIAKEGGIKPLISMLSDSSATAVGKEIAAGALQNLDVCAYSTYLMSAQYSHPGQSIL